MNKLVECSPIQGHWSVPWLYNEDTLHPNTTTLEWAAV